MRTRYEVLTAQTRNEQLARVDLSSTPKTELRRQNSLRNRIGMNYKAAIIHFRYRKEEKKFTGLQITCRVYRR